MDLIEKFVRRLAHTGTRNGEDVLCTNGDPLLVEGFARIGWSDPYPLTDKGRADLETDTAHAKAVAKDAEKAEKAAEKATLESEERAVLPRPKGHTG